jgi:hypothetical protein
MDGQVNRQITPRLTPAEENKIFTKDLRAFQAQLDEIERRIDEQMRTLDLIGWEIHKMGGGL